MMSDLPNLQPVYTGQKHCEDDKDLLFDLSSLDPYAPELLPPLRQPALSESQVLAALELELSGQFSNRSVNNDKYSSGDLDGNGQGIAHHQHQHYRTVDGKEDPGLLPQLRRPHLNQIPPEVLAVLIKTAYCSQDLLTSPPAHSGLLDNQQILLPSISGNNANSNNPSSSAAARPLVQQQQRKESGQSGAPGSAGGFPFNATAKEFVPIPKRNVSVNPVPPAAHFNPGMNTKEDVENLALAIAQMQNQPYMDDFNPDMFVQNMPDEVDNNITIILENVTDTITHVTKNPADFQRCAKNTAEILKKHLNDVDTLGIVTTLLVEQSILNPNFCYSGSRMCHFLHKKEIGVGKVNFKTMVITRCQEIFQDCLRNWETDPEIPARSRGLLMFFAELYMNFPIERGNESVPHVIFGLAAVELMSKMTKVDPMHENVKCVFQTLKLLGWHLENSSDAKLKNETETLLKNLSYLMVTGNLKPQTKLLLDDLFKLKNKNWNKNAYHENSSEPTFHSSTAPAASAIQYYELPESEEEDYEEMIMLDDEPEHVRKAYDEFLESTKFITKSKRNN